MSTNSHNLAVLQLNDALCLLCDEGYERKNVSLKPRSYEDRYTVLCVYGKMDGYTLKYFNSLDVAKTYINYCNGIAIGLYDGDDLLDIMELADQNH